MSTETTPVELPRDFAAMADRTSVDERDLIVAWLREQARRYDRGMLAIEGSAVCRTIAAAIERGEHGN